MDHAQPYSFALEAKQTEWQRNAQRKFSEVVPTVVPSHVAPGWGRRDLRCGFAYRSARRGIGRFPFLLLLLTLPVPTKAIGAQWQLFSPQRGAM
jgi:hypothetical protein